MSLCDHVECLTAELRMLTEFECCLWTEAKGDMTRYLELMARLQDWLVAQTGRG